MISAKCAARLAAAAGKPLSAGKLRAIETEFDATMRELARRDPARWRSLSRDERMAEGAMEAMKQVAADAALKEYRATLQALRTSEVMERSAAQSKVRSASVSQGYAHDLVHTDRHISAVRDEALSGLADFLKAAESRDGTGALQGLAMRLFTLDNPEMTSAIVREVFRGADGSSGSKAAQAGARAWLDTIEAMRVRFNMAGGNIGKLTYGYLTQRHDSFKIDKAGADAWADFVLQGNLLDRKQYVDTDGSILGDAQMREMLVAAHKTLASDGGNKMEPGQFAGDSASTDAGRSNRGSDHRVLHFKDGDAWMEYMKAYGEGSLYDSMLAHIGAMARDIGLTERMGPNPMQSHRVMVDLAEAADKHKGFTAQRSFGGRPDNYFRILTGEAGVPDSEKFAHVAQEVRAAETAAKLGSTLFTAMGGDVGTTMAWLHYNKLPYLDMLANIRKVSGLRRGEVQDTLISHNIINESISRGMNRFMGDNLAHGLFSNLASATMKMTWVNAWTDMLHEASQLTLAGGVARAAKKEWAQLHEYDRMLYQRAGINEADWQVLNKVTPTADFGAEHMTSRVISESGIEGAQVTADKIAAFLRDESHFTAVTPDLHTRSVTSAGGAFKPGTYAGETMRSLAQFHSFPAAMVSRHLHRMWDTPQGLEGAPLGFGGGLGDTGNRVAIIAAFTVALAMTSSIALQTKQLIAGKDPLNMDPTEPEGQKFWLKAASMGGGLSYLGDFLTRDPTDQRTYGFERYFGLAGPVAGSAGGLIDLTFGNAVEAAKGKVTHVGAEAVRFVNSHLPIVNQWQWRTVWEHLVLFQAQQALNPGYLERMRRRGIKDWEQESWWAPGDMAPSRGPDFSRIAGE